MASSRSWAVSNVPDVQVSVAASYWAPSERGKNSYQDAYRARGGRRRAGSRRWGRPARAGRTCACLGQAVGGGDVEQVFGGRSGISSCAVARRMDASTGSPAASATAAVRSSRSRPSRQTSSTSTPAGSFASALCSQVPHGSDQPSTRNVHRPSLSAAPRPPRDPGRARLQRGHVVTGLAAVGIGEDDGRVHRVVALAEHLGADRDELPDDRLGGVGAALDDRFDLRHRDAAEAASDGPAGAPDRRASAGAAAGAARLRAAAPCWAWCAASASAPGTWRGPKRRSWAGACVARSRDHATAPPDARQCRVTLAGHRGREDHHGLRGDVHNVAGSE
jgi:hypothetical protein